jgi:peptide/nickel transport system substrate-binding protein
MNARSNFIEQQNPNQTKFSLEEKIMSRKSIFLALSFLALVALALAACTPTEVVKTVIVTQEVQVAGTPVIQEVVVTATPEVVKPTARTLVVCQGQEPETLYPYGGAMLAASSVRHAYEDGPIDSNTFDYQPVILEKLPSLTDGDAVIQAVAVAAGDTVTDNDGNPAALTATIVAQTVSQGAAVTDAAGKPTTLYLKGDPVLDADGNPTVDADGKAVVYDANATYRPTGCMAADCAVEYTGGDVQVDVLGTLVRPAGCRAADCAVYYDGTNVTEMDQMVVTFKWLPGLMWSDGEPLTSADSVYAFTLYMDPDTPNPSRYTGERTASYVATDDVTNVWTGLPGYMDAVYNTNVFGPLPQHILGQYTAADIVTAYDADKLYVGWGAYIIDSWEKGTQITMHKNPNYFRASEGLPKFDNLVYRFIGTDPNAAIAAVLAGECDIVTQDTALDGQSQLLLELQAKGQINATFITGTSWEHADFDIRPFETIVNSGAFAGWDEDGDGMGPFGDVRLRQAVAMCMDRQAVVDTVLYGQSVVIDTYIPPNHPLFNAEVKHWPYDPVAAAALLDEIGWLDEDGDPATPRTAKGVTGVPDGTALSFTLETTTAAMRQQYTQILAQNLAGCGMAATLNYYSATQWFADGPEGKLFGRLFDIGAFTFSTGVQPACELYISSMIPSPENGWSGQNETGYSNPAYDTACNTALQSLPGEEAYVTNHKEAQRIFGDELPVVPLFLRLKLAATRPDMCNFIMDPTANSEMWNIENFDYGPSCNQ